MQRKITIEIKVSDDGKYCLDCTFVGWRYCNLFFKELRHFKGKGLKRCKECIEGA